MTLEIFILLSQVWKKDVDPFVDVIRGSNESEVTYLKDASNEEPFASSHSR